MRRIVLNVAVDQPARAPVILASAIAAVSIYIYIETAWGGSSRSCCVLVDQNARYQPQATKIVGTHTNTSFQSSLKFHLYSLCFPAQALGSY